MSRLVELSHRITEGMITYPGVPGPRLGVHLSREASREVYAPGTEFHIGTVELVANTGTYLDTPYHRYPEGPDLSGVPLESLADLPGLVVRAEGAPSVGLDRLAGLDVRGRAVLLHTGWDRHWGTGAYGDPAPYLTGAAARALVDRGARLVGIDSVNIDDTDSAAGGERPAHSVLLAAGVPVLEHLTGLGGLPTTGARLHTAPPRV